MGGARVDRVRRPAVAPQSLFDADGVAGGAAGFFFLHSAPPPPIRAWARGGDPGGRRNDRAGVGGGFRMSANNRRAWTPDVIETMRALAASGKGCRLIGRALGGIPKSTGKEACARFGIALSRLPGGQQTTWTPDADAELARMWKAGHSSYALADHFGRARKGIANRIKRLGLIGCMRAAPIKGPLTAHMPGEDRKRTRL